MRSNLVLAGLAAWVAAGPAAAQPYRPDEGTLLQVGAEGSVDVPPDTMTVYASVVTTGATAAEALAHNNALAARLIDAVKASRLEVARLSTTNLDVNARFSGNRDDSLDNAQVPRILGYVADNTLEVELAQVDQAGDLISLLFEAGANEIRGPSFTLADPRPARRRAEQAAIAEARAEAESYAGALGMKVVRVVRVFDRDFRDGDDDRIVVTGSRIRPTPIEPGDVTFTAIVHVEFLLEPEGATE